MDPSPRPSPRRSLVAVVALLVALGLLAAPTAAGAATASSDTTPAPSEPASTSTEPASTSTAPAPTDTAPSDTAPPDTAPPDAAPPDTEPMPEGSPGAPPQAQIIGGSQAPPGAWPSQVALVLTAFPDNESAFFCGGTLIARSWVLTAGHCLRDLRLPDDPSDDWTPRAADIAVLVGTQDLSSGGTRVPAAELRPHPAWLRYDGRNDIGLIRLDTPAPADVPVQALTAQGVSPAAGTPVVATGWGTTSPDQPSYPARLRQVTLDITAPATCADVWGEFYQSSTMVCAAAAGRDTCAGDSGGPLLEDRNGTWVQVAITSTGEGCADPRYPGIYTRLAAFATWIGDQIRYGPQPDGASFVRRMWLDAYDRLPTASELNIGLTNFARGQAPEVYARNLLNQSTYQTRTGGVIRLYQAVFLRRPDRSGLGYWWREVNRGVSLRRVAALMVGAPEFKARYGDLDDAGFVDLVYDNVLGRAPSSADRAYWVGELESGRRTRGGVMVGFSESAEYKAATNPDTRVIGDFFALLRRVPSEDDIDFWGARSGQALVTTIIRSWEYANRF